MCKRRIRDQLQAQPDRSNPRQPAAAGSLRYESLSGMAWLAAAARARRSTRMGTRVTWPGTAQTPGRRPTSKPPRLGGTGTWPRFRKWGSRRAQGTHAAALQDYYRSKYEIERGRSGGVRRRSAYQVSLPLFAAMRNDEQDYVIAALEEVSQPPNSHWARRTASRSSKQAGILHEPSHFFLGCASHHRRPDTNQSSRDAYIIERPIRPVKRLDDAVVHELLHGAASSLDPKERGRPPGRPPTA